MPPQRRRKAVICLPPDNPDAMTELVPMAVDALAKREEQDVTEEPTTQRFEEPYVLVRLLSVDGDDSYDVEFEHSGFRDRDGAMNFLRGVIDHGKDA